LVRERRCAGGDDAEGGGLSCRNSLIRRLRGDGRSFGSAPVARTSGTGNAATPRKSECAQNDEKSKRERNSAHNFTPQLVSAAGRGRSQPVAKGAIAVHRAHAPSALRPMSSE
jgi:hypothetical protein